MIKRHELTNEEWSAIKELLPPEITGKKGTFITDNNAKYTIPPKANNPNQWACDFWLYKERHLVECFFQKIKWFRRVATRYDKRDNSFLAFIYIASIAILVK